MGDLRARARGAGFRLRLNAPEELLSARQQRIRVLRQGLEAGLNKKIQARQAAFQLLAARLRASSPLNRLTGGYAYAAHEDGTAVQSAASLTAGERLNLRFLDGAAEVRVEEIRREQQEEENHGRKA